MAINKRYFDGESTKMALNNLDKALKQGPIDLQTSLDRPLNDCKQAKNSEKTWKNVVVTNNNVEFKYFNGLEWPILACQGLSLPFSDLFSTTGPHSTITAAKNLDEWART